MREPGAALSTDFMRDTMPTREKPIIRIAPNNPVFDLPVIVGIQEGLFDRAGLNVQFTATYADRETDKIERPVMSRLKEHLFECSSADTYNVSGFNACETKLAA
jgi:NitT/TauT family transport system substrate-binding protein